MPLIGQAVEPRLIALIALLGIVPACQSDPPSQEDMLQAANNLVQPEPGLYRSTSTLEAFDLAGASQDDAERMQFLMGGLEPQVSTACLSQEDSEQGFVSLLREIRQGDCSFESFDAGATRFRAEMQCNGADGTSSHVSMYGTTAAESSRMELDIEQQGPAIPGRRLDMQFVVENQRIGDC